MALNGTTDGTAVAAAVKAAATSQGIVAGTPITDAQLTAIWVAVFTSHDPYIVANAVVSVNTGPGAGSTGTIS